MSGGDRVKGRRLGRRALLGGAAALWPALALAQQPPRPAPPPAPPRRQPIVELSLPPVVFVHGNGDSSALWINNIWRFEANGYKRNQLFAIDFAYPNARRDDAKPEPFRSSAEDQMKELAAFVAQVLKATRRRKVALVGSSRGGNAIRSYLKNGGGAEYVRHAVRVRHSQQGHRDLRHPAGRQRVQRRLPVPQGSQFGAGRSDSRRRDDGDPLRQERQVLAADGRFIGAPGKPTGVSYDASELRGARNVILDGLDHRETAFNKLAFAAMYDFIAGRAPASMFIAQEPLPVLNGKVTGVAEGSYTNLAVAGAEVDIFEIDGKTGERKSAVAMHRKTTGEDGVWGPFVGRSNSYYEFVLTMAAQPVTHTYRSPFLRSSDVVHLRPGIFAKGDEVRGGHRQHEPAARLFRRRPRQVQPRR